MAFSASFAPTSSVLERSSFLASTIPLPPLHSRRTMFQESRSIVSTKYSLSQDQGPASRPAPAARREILVGLVTTGAALAACSNSVALAASGPGSKGAQRTAQKADELLKAADKLNMQEAPKSFGPGTPGVGAQDAGKIAQRAGSGAIPEIQDGAAKVAKRAQKNSGEVVGNVQKGAKDIVGQAQEKKLEGESATKDALSEAQKKVDNGGVLSSLQESLENLKESVAQKGSEAKNIIEGATNDVQKTVH